jgi:RNA polymerase sigma-70 factor (ECF subfamily)
MYAADRAMKLMSLPGGPSAAGPNTPDWVRRFHAGERRLIEEIYRDHHALVVRTMTALLGLTDGETASHELFLRLMTQASLRGSFRAGVFAAWLVVVARNHAIDYRRRQGREIPSGNAALAEGATLRDATHARSEARLLLERVLAEVVPPAWAGVFHARFLRQMSQPEAARHLGISRTTLAYRELRLRRLLRRFALRGTP